MKLAVPWLNKESSKNQASPIKEVLPYKQPKICCIFESTKCIKNLDQKEIQQDDLKL